MEMEDIKDFVTLPEITPDIIEDVKSLFANYIFYRRTKINKPDMCGGNVKVRTCECTCTACDRTYLHDFTDHTHNDRVTCPKCGAEAYLKSAGYSKNNLAERQRVVIVCPENESRVWLRAYYVDRKFSKHDLTNEIITDLRFEETTRYILEPHSARCFKSWYTYSSQKMIWQEAKNITEPFGPSMGYIPDYTIINLGGFKNTFLKYLDTEAYKAEVERYVCSSYYYYGSPINSMLVKYICAFAQYPIIEKLIKAGFGEIVCEMVIYKRPCKRIFDWKAESLDKFFKHFSRSEIRYLRGRNQKIMFAQAYLRYRKLVKKPDIDRLNLMLMKYGQGGFDDLCTIVKRYGLKFEKAARYLEKQFENKIGKKNEYFSIQSCLEQWKDYLNFAHDLSYDLSDPVVMFPKDIKKAHDRASDILSAIKREAEEKAMRERTEKLKKKYTFSYGELTIKVPESMQEIIDEGKALRHCVGGYAARHADGKVIILFVRKLSDPETPFVTMEIAASDGKRVVQYHGFRNDADQPLPAQVQEFIEEFKLYIAHPRAYMKRRSAEAEKEKAIA